MTGAMLDGFVAGVFEHDGVARTVYVRGAGPGVVIMHELPGITPELARFATTIAEAGFCVSVPHFFGEVGRPYGNAYALRELAKICIRREISILARRRSSPLVEWIRALCRAEHARIGGKGVGAIGMCITGNFALAMLVDEVVMAPVLAQPSLPLLSLGKRGRAALHVSDAELDAARDRARAGARILAMRFTRDLLCPPERMERLREELGDSIEVIEIDSSRGNPHGIPEYAHSVLTVDLVDEPGHPTRVALDRTITFLRERLS